MRSRRFALIALALSCLAVTAQSAPNPNAIREGIGHLRSLPDAERGPRTGELARQIAALPPSKDKNSFAIALSHLSTEGDPGRDNLQAVTTTLAQALLETPMPVKGDIGLSPYSELAELVRYESMTVPEDMKNNADFVKATEALVAEDNEISKIDFTLRDIHNRKWTLSELRGKVVMVNFWATWCPPCRVELPNLDLIADQYASQVVILALTDEDPFKVTNLLRGHESHFNILFDEGHKVGKQFRVNGLPRTFVFDRNGKLVTQSIDMRTQRQFLNMLAQAGVHPEQRK
jgi:thiol-disulfide isomerase/thioredoxin